MRKLFFIFAIATNYVKVAANVLLIFFIFFVTLFSCWLYVDYQEVNQKNLVFYQQELVNVVQESPDFIKEQRKLIDYKRQYDTLRQYWFVDLIIGSRPSVNIKLIAPRLDSKVHEP